MNTREAREMKRRVLEFLLSNRQCEVGDCDMADPRYLSFITADMDSPQLMASRNRPWQIIMDAVERSAVVCSYHRDELARDHMRIQALRRERKEAEAQALVEALAEYPLHNFHKIKALFK